MNSDIIDSEIREEFKRDFLDQLQEVERLLLKLESDPQNLEFVRDIFRPFHTIKGNAGIIGETEIQDISQHAETLLDQVRSGQRKLTGSMIEAIFQSVDLIRSIVETGDAQFFSDKTDQLRVLLKSVSSPDSAADTDIFNIPKTIAIPAVKISYDSAVHILKHLTGIDKKIIQCRIDRDFENHLFDIFDHVLALALFFEKSITMPHTAALLKYLERYLTIINTSNLSYSKDTWELLDIIKSDIMKSMYMVLIDGMDVGVCYFNPEDTLEDLEKSLEWLIKNNKKSIIININKNRPPQLDEIRSLMELQKTAKVPIAYIQRFFGHKMHWRNVDLLMADSFKMETSFWRALESFIHIRG